MWEKKVEKTQINVSKELIWDIMTSIDTWKHWNPDLQEISIEGEFTEGQIYHIKMDLAPKVKMKIIEVKENRYFIDQLSLPGAKLKRKFEVLEKGNGVDIGVTISLSGVSANMWKSLVAEKLFQKVPKMLGALEDFVSKVASKR